MGSMSASLRLLFVLAVVCAFPAKAAPMDALADELEVLIADAIADRGAHDALESGARRDAQVLHLLDIYRRAKTLVTAEEWQALPAPDVERFGQAFAARDGDAHELLGFLRTYDAQDSDIRPLLERLRR
jgi:hypothetical protein